MTLVVFSVSRQVTALCFLFIQFYHCAQLYICLDVVAWKIHKTETGWNYSRRKKRAKARREMLCCLVQGNW